MRDTSEAVHNRMLEMMRQKSGEERLKMGFSMFDMAKHIVRASLSQEQDDSGIRAQLFMRFYGKEYTREQREKIVRHLEMDVRNARCANE